MQLHYKCDIRGSNHVEGEAHSQKQPPSPKKHKSLHCAGCQIHSCWNDIGVLCFDLPPLLYNSDIVYLLHW